MNLRKFKKITWTNKVDVLIVDEVGSEWIRQCIPSTCSVAVLPVRGGVPYIKSFKFIILIVLLTIENNFHLGLSLIETIIRIMNPEVIISFIDNGARMPFLQKKFPGKLVISVQNGVRGDEPNVFRLIDRGCKVPVYFGFGDYEYDLMSHRNVAVEKYIPAGSLKLGLFLSKQYEILGINNTSICFISQYRYGMVNSADPVKQRFVKLSQDVYGLTVRYCLRNYYSCVVAMTSDKDDERYNHEVEFFRSASHCQSSTIRLIPNRKLSLKSYETAYLSQILVSVNSTLCFEMFGCGKKVLFCLPDDWDSNVNNFYIAKLLEKMPEEVLLLYQDDLLFAKKMDALLQMNNEGYLCITRQAREYFMRCEKPYPHERIYNLIKRKLI